MEGVNPDHHEAVQRQVEEQQAEIENTLAEISDTVIRQEDIQGLAAALPEGVDSSGVELRVENVQAHETEAKIVGQEEDGTPIVRLVITKLVYEISLVNLGDGSSIKELGSDISAAVTLPEAELDDDANVAKIRHGLKDDADPEVNEDWERLADSPITRKEGEAPTAVIRTNSFSPFELTMVHEDPMPTTSSRGSGSGGTSRNTNSTASGQWVQDESGWWYRNADGTWPASTWLRLTWNGVSNWYYFNAAGYMASGWVLDADQNWYFLHNIADGTQGHMYTGWHEIDGAWYYFRENAGGPLGSLIVNGQTPDGYQVDANGARIQ